MSKPRVQEVMVHGERQPLRTRPCPEALAALIRLANLVLPELELPGTGEMFSPREIVRKLRTHPPDRVAVDTVRAFFKQHFAPEKFPQLYNYLGPIRPDRLDEVYFRYRLLRDTRTLLSAIAGSGHPILPGSRMSVPFEALESGMALAVDSDGKIQVERGDLLEVIKGVEAERIRSCPECKSIFWAGRLDKFACSQCVGKRRVRLYRERYAGRYAENYKHQRIRKANTVEESGTRPQSATRCKPNS